MNAFPFNTSRSLWSLSFFTIIAAAVAACSSGPDDASASSEQHVEGDGRGDAQEQPSSAFLSCEMSVDTAGDVQKLPLTQIRHGLICATIGQYEGCLTDEGYFPPVWPSVQAEINKIVGSTENFPAVTASNIQRSSFAENGGKVLTTVAPATGSKIELTCTSVQ